MGETPDTKRIGKNLQQIRKKAGYRSAQAFAEHIGMKPTAYAEYEQGRRVFNYEQAWIMADALECSMDELGGREWPPDAPEDAAEAAEIAQIYRDITEPGQRALMMTARAAKTEYASPDPNRNTTR